MPDNKKKRGPADRSRVALNEKWEVAYWTKRFNVDVSALRRAVAHVGHMADDVRDYLSLARRLRERVALNRLLRRMRDKGWR